MTNWATTEVFYNDDWSSWGVQALDGRSVQIGDAEWFYRKSDAVDTARAYLDSDRCELVIVFTKAGKAKVIKAA